MTRVDNGMTLIRGSSHFSANACLAPICSLHHVAVTTIEGIGSTKTRLHPVQVIRVKGVRDKAADLHWVVGLSVTAQAEKAGGLATSPSPPGWEICAEERGGTQA